MLEPHQERLPKLQTLPIQVRTDPTRILASLQGYVTLRRYSHEERTAVCGAEGA
jgi:hypothetical protein